MSERPSGATVGWTAFAGTTMIVLGTWWIIAGLVGIFDSGELFVATGRWIFRLDSKTWGWIHIVEGIIMLREKAATVMRSKGIRMPAGAVMVLEHIVLSHHGVPEFGSPKVPSTPCSWSFPGIATPPF